MIVILVRLLEHLHAKMLEDDTAPARASTGWPGSDRSRRSARFRRASCTTSAAQASRSDWCNRRPAGRSCSRRCRAPRPVGHRAGTRCRRLEAGKGGVPPYAGEIRDGCGALRSAAVAQPQAPPSAPRRASAAAANVTNKRNSRRCTFMPTSLSWFARLKRVRRYSTPRAGTAHVSPLSLSPQVQARARVDRAATPLRKTDADHGF